MRSHFLAVGIAGTALLMGCASHRLSNVEVTPSVVWVVSDDSGRHCTTNRYAPFVVRSGVPFTLDFSQHDSFRSPDTDKTERYFDGVVASITVTASNTTAVFSGRTAYQLHLGVTASYTEDDASLYGQTLRLYSTRFHGSSTFGHTIELRAGEDINDEPSVCLSFRQTPARISRFTGLLLDDSH
jgi:hypothetical protein